MIASGKKINGFTLIEILIVMVIMGVLAAITLPSYKSSVQNSRRADGKAALLDLAARSEKFFAQNNQYTAVIDLASGLSLGRTTSSEGYYNLEIVKCVGGELTRCYLLTATGTGVQADDTGCASLSIDNVGRKTAKNSAAAAADYCW
jgi:type IV pilus assembly protein PilE